jgi:hypothetical protein
MKSSVSIRVKGTYWPPNCSPVAKPRYRPRTTTVVFAVTTKGVMDTTVTCAAVGCIVGGVPTWSIAERSA